MCLAWSKLHQGAVSEIDSQVKKKRKKKKHSSQNSNIFQNFLKPVFLKMKIINAK